MKTLLTLTALFWTAVAGAQSKSRGTVFHLGSVAPDPVGILYPGIGTAAGINPAALGNLGKITAVQAAYGPALRSGDSHRYLASFTTAKKGFGLGVGIDGESPGGGSFTNGGFVGMGFYWEKVGVGISVRDADVGDSSGPDVDVGMLFGESRGLNLGFVIYELQGNARATLGVGYSSGKRYNLEFNLQLPPFNNFSGSYGFSLGANVFAGPLGILFRTTYYTGPESFVHTLGTGAWLNDRFHLGLEFSTPRLWTLGITLVF